MRLPLMPLGVEHSGTWEPLGNREFVRLPLMPLGVEHEKSSLSESGLSRAITFDAVRR